MTLTEMRERLQDLTNQLNTAINAGLTLAQDQQATAEQLTANNTTVNGLRARVDAMRNAITAEEGHQRNQAGRGAPAYAPAGDRGAQLHALLGSNEYARAFAAAIRNGARPGREYSDAYKPLYDALTIGGGTTAGEQGGFLVPDDVNTQIRELRRQLHPLADHFNVETVSSNSGWRVKDKGLKGGFTALSAEATDNAVTALSDSDSDMFDRVTYTLTTYGLVIPVSNELTADETAGLLQYLSRMFGRYLVKAENTLLKGLLDSLTATNIVPTTGSTAIDQLKTVLNKDLDPDISASAEILTNQDGYNYLDSLKDSDGRPLMQPCVSDPTATTIKGRPVIVLSNMLLPTTTITTTGSTKGDYYPMYIGDYREFGTLFARGPLEMLSTDVGGKAFRSNSTEVRGIVRMAAKAFDTGAAVRRPIFIAAT